MGPENSKYSNNFAIIRIRKFISTQIPSYRTLFKRNIYNFVLQETLTNLNTGKSSGAKDKSRIIANTRFRQLPPQNQSAPLQQANNLAPTSANSSQNQSVNSGRKTSKR